MTIGITGDIPVPGRLHVPDSAAIITFGYGHGAPPEAHVVFDVRSHFGDADLGPGLRDLDGENRQVEKAVRDLPGVNGLVEGITNIAFAYLFGSMYTSRRGVVIAIGCDDGRQRSVVIAHEVSTLLGYEGKHVTVYDRDINRPAPAPSAEPTR